MDQIIIKDLAVHYHVGVPVEERAQPQRLVLTLVMDHDFSAAAAGDAIDQTINYQAVADRLTAFGTDRSWKLIETLAVEIAETVLREFKPTRVSVEIKKFILPNTRYVGVRVVREAGTK